jgi:hypothetical protein
MNLTIAIAIAAVEARKFALSAGEHSRKLATRLAALALGVSRPDSAEIEDIEDLREFSWCLSTARAVGVFGPWREDASVVVFDDGEGYLVVVVIDQITLDNGRFIAGTARARSGWSAKSFLLDAERRLSAGEAGDLVKRAADITDEPDESDESDGDSYGFDGGELQ